MHSTRMRLRRRLARARRTGEEGFALVLVLGMATVMTLLVGGGVLYATSAAEKGGMADVSNSAAYNAAMAGVADFTARVNNDLAYCQELDENGGDPSNPALTGWTSVKGTPAKASDTTAYRYEVTSDCNVATGDSSDIKLRVTGISGPKTGPVDPEVRTITAEIKRPGFRDYVFFTDKEEDDPDLPQFTDFNDQAERDSCKVYSYTKSPKATNTRSSSSPPCKNLSFLTGDTLNGKVHSNDMIRIGGNPEFKAPVTSGCPGKVSTDPCFSTKYIAGSGTPKWYQNKPPTTDVTLSFPADDSSVRDAALKDNKGCVYRGPTRIVLLATGKMSVTSPQSTATATCPLGANVNMPQNGVIFVDEIKVGTPGYRTTCPAPWVTSPTSSGNPNTGGNSYPLANDSDVTKSFITCNEGNLWIEGTLDGIADIGTENNIYITGDIKYKDGLTADTSNDGLGLVAQKSIRFYHPMKVTQAYQPATPYIPGTPAIPAVPATPEVPATPGSPEIPAHCERYDTATSKVTTTETTTTNCNRKFNYNNVNAAGVITGSTCTGSSNGCSAGTWVAKVPAVAPTPYIPANPGSPYVPAVPSQAAKAEVPEKQAEICPTTCGDNLRIDAALLSIKHSIGLPYYNQTDWTSNMGTLTINGSVAQFYRGGVKSGTSGYSKSYNYDKRLVNIVLPGFPKITSTFGNNGFTAEKAAYTRDKGACFGGWRTDPGCTATSP